MDVNQVVVVVVTPPRLANRLDSGFPLQCYEVGDLPRAYDSWFISLPCYSCMAFVLQYEEVEYIVNVIMVIFILCTRGKN